MCPSKVKIHNGHIVHDHPFLDITIYEGPKFYRTGQLSTSIFFKQTNTFSYLHGSSYISNHVLKGIAVGEIVRTLRNTSSAGYFKVVKRALIKKFYQRGFPQAAIKAAKNIQFGMRESYLQDSEKRQILGPIPIRTKFHNYIPSVVLIFRSAWARILDDPVLSQYFPTAPFPVWTNHPNVKGILSYKHKPFQEVHSNWEFHKFVPQKFNRPTPRKRSNTM